ncbi:MAG: CaiB/BaiF CoA-transferase family protein [SAR324 cluster bacterium]|nr:CaiB/BaiF CoA-transferase family protein [SAR324 cluster bacterium]MCZ6729191.1 CaiB/BaiF CoA-transferase family protein [SAR324 cluster bacterium]
MGPLAGIKVVEMAGIGPGPFCAMALSDMGAEVLRIDRTEPSGLGIVLDPKFDLLKRGRRSVAIDLKDARGAETVLRLVEQADALIEGFRPGVMERLGVGPDECLRRNPRLVYGRMTGWGQDGPMAKDVGHDINYIALAGVLHCIGSQGGVPVPPMNLVGDFGGGAMFLAFGIVSALLEAAKSGKGQVVDVSMVEGAAYLMTSIYGLHASGIWNNERGSNLLDGGAHYYNVYETSDGKYVSVGAIEPKFYQQLLERTGLEGEELPGQQDRDAWPQFRRRLAEIFKTHTRDEWCEIMEGAEVCFAPVLYMDEVRGHSQNAARESFLDIDGVVQPAPAPRFSRTASQVQSPPARRGEHSAAALKDWGIPPEEVQALCDAGVVDQT